MPAKSYSLLELNEYLKRVLALNVKDQVWVRCEIAQANVTRGHFYLDLVEKRGEELVAKSKAIVWQRDANKLAKKLKGALQQVLQPGIQALLLVKIDFHEVYGLKFIVSDIDPSFTLGQLELKKRAVIGRLSAKGLFDKNRQLAFPIVPQRVAVLSSERAAGWKDFLAHLENNPYGYRFEIALFSASVQGELAVKELMQQLGNISDRKEAFDVVVIIRGGGSRLDLMAFDDEKLCTKISECPLPVLTGIGHEVDETIADMVAFTALKTPTAVAGFLIETMIRFESHLNRMQQRIQLASNSRLNTEKIRMDSFGKTLELISRQRVKKEIMILSNMEDALYKASSNTFNKAKLALSNLENTLNLLNPRTILERGYSLTTKGDDIIKNADSVIPGEVLTTHLKKGSIETIVK